MSETRSVFLYGKPTVLKMNLLKNTQREYTILINKFINIMGQDPTYLLDLLTNNKQSPKVRSLEKEVRKSHQLGSAYGQNAVDMAVKELHNHVIRIRNKVYGYIQQVHPEMEMYISFLSLLNAAIMKTDEIVMMEGLIEKENQKKKPSKSKVEDYQKRLMVLKSLSEEKREYYKETVANLFLDKLTYMKLPYVAKSVPLQLDSRLSTIEKSHSTKENFIVYVKLLGEKDRVAFPVSTSRNGLRRMNQYDTGSMTIKVTNHGKVRIGVPFTKKIQTKEMSNKNILSFDAGITDLIYTNTGNSYGSFCGMRKLYEEIVEVKLGHRSSLRNKMREYQKELKRSTNLYEKARLREKIQQIARSLNGRKKKDKCLRQYAHQADLRINEAVCLFIEEAKRSHSICAYEDLDITEFDRGRKNNKRDSMWVRGQLTKKIQSKLNWLGIPHVAVDPAYTSKMCPKCFNIDDHNRKAKSFVCTVCKHEDDADHNAAVNIGQRAFDDEVMKLVEKYPYNTNKRHAALKELFEQRHRSYISVKPVA